MTHSKTGVGSARRAERRKRAIELRREGKTWLEIGAELDVSEATARRDVSIAVDADRQAAVDEAAEMRREQAAQLEMVQQAAWEAFGDDQDRHAALGQIVRASERLAKLYGLDAPTRVAVGDDPLASMTDERAREILDVAD